MSALAIVFTIVALLAVTAVALYLFWPRASELGELARIKGEEQLALWQLQSLGRSAAERMRQEHDEHRR